MIALTLYTRPGCHLCEVMSEELAPLVRGRAEVTVVDVTANDGLERRYGTRIPVLVAGAEELSFYRLDSVRVERFLAGARDA